MDSFYILIAAILMTAAGLVSSVVTAMVIKDECATFGKTKIQSVVFVCTKTEAKP